MSARVTIKSIARDLGISHMTVSRALSNHPNVQEQTRKAVIAHAAKLGYVKSAAADAMRGNSTRIVGLLLPNITNDFYAHFANDLAHACETRSFHLIIHLTNDNIDLEKRSIQRLREVHAMAVIMVPAPGQADNLPHLKTMNVVKLIRERDLAVPASSVLVDDEAAIINAVIQLKEQGHKKIAYIGTDSTLSSGRVRLKAYRSGLKSAGLRESPELIFSDTPSFDMGQTSAAQVLDKQLATAIVCGGFEISDGALNKILESEIRIGVNFGFVGYGDPSFYAWVNGGITTISIPVNKLVAQTIELLETPDPGLQTQQYSFPAKLIIRSSTIKESTDKNL